MSSADTFFAVWKRGLLRRDVRSGLYFRTLASGEPLMLALHGWLRSSTDFGALLEGLPAVAPDLPGFGWSEDLTPPSSSQGFADCVSRLLDDLNVDRVVVLGHSFGGRVGLRLALSDPQRVSSLILSGTPLTAHPEVAELLGAGVIPLSSAGEVAEYDATPPRLRHSYLNLLREEPGLLLRQVVQPVTLIWGLADSRAPTNQIEPSFGYSQETHERIYLEGEHFALFSHRDLVRTELRRHLQDASVL